MSNDFNRKIIWITGASSGIGEALAYAFSFRGASLILSGRRTAELERVQLSCRYPDQVKILPLDLSDIPSLENKTEDAIRCFGQIDILVHNGGISQRSLVVETPLEIHRKVMEVDYFSYVAITKAILPHFLSRKAGHFVVTSSVMGKIGTPMRSAYAAAKHALHGFFDCLRAEVSPHNIKVTILTPGYIKTNVALNAITKDGTSLGKQSKNISNGLSPGKAAVQILKAISRGSYETYIGKFGGEKISLWIMRFAPGVLIKRAPSFGPK
ncbi:MAG TPA: SDR family oxidoreductase [Puia sp.]|nr:SDR family oxidoreductase [Puia sp.]